MANTFYSLNLRSQSGKVTRLFVDANLTDNYNFVLPSSPPANNQTIAWNGTKFVWFDLSVFSGGTVTSVGLTAPSIFTVTGSPITTSGTLAISLNNQSGNVVFASPSNGSSGVPTFRQLVRADLPGSTASRFDVNITNANLSSGLYTLSHNLGKRPIISVIDNTGEIVGLRIIHTNENTASIDFNAVGNIPGTWTIIAIA